jgi:hypothetical protein
MISFKDHLQENTDPNYHSDIHQDMQHLAGQHRSTNMGAANYHHLSKQGGKVMDDYYNKTIVPHLHKHGYPNRFTDKMHQVQKDVVSNWKKETKHE